jgi:hypothetical protein
MIYVTSIASLIKGILLTSPDTSEMKHDASVVPRGRHSAYHIQFRSSVGYKYCQKDAASTTNNIPIARASKKEVVDMNANVVFGVSFVLTSAGTATVILLEEAMPFTISTLFHKL